MAAVTMSGLAALGTITSVGGMLASASQAIGQNKAMKQYERDSKKATEALKSITEQNAFKQLQVPTLGTQLAKESQAQREVQTMNMIQGAGAEGVIGAAGQLTVAGQEEALKNAARLDELKYERDAMQAQAQQGINSRKQERDFYIGMGEKADAEARRAQAEENRNAAIQSIFTNAGDALSSASGLVGLYKNKNSKVSGSGKATYTAPEVNSMVQGDQSNLLQGQAFGGIDWSKM